jgi:3-deoxy-D-manno-octulosonate 8-phosphate phosphatase (KDO 8-P phosphatase)
MTVELEQRARAIRLLLMDVDGVLTDGKIFNVPLGAGQIAETKGFHAQDGIALQWLSWHSVQTGVISGRDSPATTERAKQVGMTYVYQGHIEKIPIFEEIVAKSGLSPSQIAYAGDDLTDLPLLRRAGLAFAPANARNEVKAAAHYVTNARGGEGAVREMIELLMTAQGSWEAILQKYRTA